MAVVGIQIRIADPAGEFHPLPYLSAAEMPVFEWDIPARCQQISYIFELRAANGTTYSSGRVESTIPRHAVTTALPLATWGGPVECRLRIYNALDELDATTHYFADGIPLWESDEDALYFLRMGEIPAIAGTLAPRLQWRNPADPEADALEYHLQWATTPLFDSGRASSAGTAGLGEMRVQGTDGLYTAANPVLATPGAVFWRVRAYDGYDYGQWSATAGFLHSPAPAPAARFNWVAAVCTPDNPNEANRPNGEVVVSFTVEDSDTPLVSAYLSYDLGDGERVPCSLAESTLAIPTGRPAVVTWNSVRQFPDTVATVRLWLSAYDGAGYSEAVRHDSPVYINNRGIGASGTVASSDFRYGVAGRCGDIGRFILAPAEHLRKRDGETIPVGPPSGIDPDDWAKMNWGAYWAARLGTYYSRYAWLGARELCQRYPVRICRPDYRLYDGYDDGDCRLGDAEILLEYRDEFNARPHPGETWTEYWKDRGLGLGVPSISFFRKPALYGHRFALRRPRIVYAGESGVYYDGMALEGDAEALFKSRDGVQRDMPEGAEELLASSFWPIFPALHRFYAPNPPKTNRHRRRFLGPAEPAADGIPGGGDGWYWTRFEYPLRIPAPVFVRRGVNDSFSYRLNHGPEIVGSVLPLGAESLYISLSADIPAALLEMLALLFPAEIFEPISAGNVILENGEYRVTARSRKSCALHSFQFGGNSPAAAVFGFDSAPRVSIRHPGGGVDSELGLAFRDEAQYEEEEDSPLYDCGMDDGDWIGKEGEINAAEPLFTCDPIHVNKHGCHFKYTPKRFALSGRIYIRKYRTETVYPFEDAARGHRNFALVPAGKNALGEDLYIRRELPGPGGKPPKSLPVTVVFRGRTFAELGWWPGDAEDFAPKDCLSHRYDETLRVYYRKSPLSFAGQLAPLVCCRAEYVDIAEAWEKPAYALEQGGHKITRLQTAGQRGAVAYTFFQYLLGAYRAAGADGYAPYGESRRYAENWAASAAATGVAGVTIDPWLIAPRGNTGFVAKYGYQPDCTLQNYFKISKMWEGRSITFPGAYVHGITTDVGLSHRPLGRVIKEMALLPDTFRRPIPPDIGTTAPYLDYRVGGNLPYFILNYFSSLPPEEHDAYATRPKGPYGEDRPLRISGYIDMMQRDIPWQIIYLQTEWNTYNLIHWEGTQDENIAALLECAALDSAGAPGRWYSVRTTRAVWLEAAGAWVVPYKRLRQSAYLDTLNGRLYAREPSGEIVSRAFEDGSRYIFRISAVNINSGTASTPRLSTPFTYSQSAASPPVITNVAYDPWRREFAISFRFDDAKGRKYDITNLHYAIYLADDGNPPDSAFRELGTEPLTGDVQNLDSNRTGDVFEGGGAAIIHTVRVGADYLGDFAGKLIRFRLSAVPAADRSGMDTPVFSFLMWGNEHLKLAEDAINAAAGRTCRWVLDEQVNEQTGATTARWKYVPREQAVTIPGDIAIQERAIAGITAEFEEWYAAVARWDSPDYDARLACLAGHPKALAGHLDTLREQFIAAGYAADYAQFCNLYLDADGIQQKRQDWLRERFIDRYGLLSEFGLYQANRGPGLLAGDAAFAADFAIWWDSHAALSAAATRESFLAQEDYTGNYETWRAENGRTDDDSARSDYIAQAGLDSAWRAYHETANRYHDGRFAARQSYVAAHAAEYASWRENPIDAYGNSIALPAGEGDQLHAFMASDPARFGIQLANPGRQAAWDYNLGVHANGMTTGQRLAAAYTARDAANRRLLAAWRRKAELECAFRSELVGRGYFCNGWRGNSPWRDDGAENIVFRFRVENKPANGPIAATYTPSAAPEYGDTAAPIAGWDTRWDIYFQFQLDFFDSFDSQNGRPLRDYLWTRLDCSGYVGDALTLAIRRGEDDRDYIRIPAGIEADSGGMHILPGDVYNPNATGAPSPSTDDPYSFQFTGKFAIPKYELPGELATDILPPGWGTGDAAAGAFDHIYFWRVRPYNLVNRPAMEAVFAEFGAAEEIGRAMAGGRVWRADLAVRFFGGDSYALLGDGHSLWNPAAPAARVYAAIARHSEPPGKSRLAVQSATRPYAGDYILHRGNADSPTAVWKLDGGECYIRQDVEAEYPAWGIYTTADADDSPEQPEAEEEYLVVADGSVAAYRGRYDLQSGSSRNGTGIWKHAEAEYYIAYYNAPSSGSRGFYLAGTVAAAQRGSGVMIARAYSGAPATWGTGVSCSGYTTTYYGNGGTEPLPDGRTPLAIIARGSRDQHGVLLGADSIFADGYTYNGYTTAYHGAPHWAIDAAGPCWDPAEPCLARFFPATDADGFDSAAANPARREHHLRVARGELSFLTDRPREIRDGRLVPIADTEGHFSVDWTGGEGARMRPWAWREEKAACWRLVCQKPLRERNGVVSHGLVLCLGLHPNCWAEQRLLFPASPLDEPGDSLAGAESFENPCVLPVANGYWLYCNVREATGYAVYRSFSADLDRWEAFRKCTFAGGAAPLFPAVYAADGNYELYGIEGTGGTSRLRRYASADGIAFGTPDTLYADFYTLTRPSRCGDRIYFGMENAGNAKIYSIAAAGGDLRAEKGNPIPADASTAPRTGEMWADPFVFADNDRGCPIARLLYRAPANAHAYQSDPDEPVALAGILEDRLFTEYLEEYKWREIPLGRNGEYDYGFGQNTIVLADGTEMPVLAAGGRTIAVADGTAELPAGPAQVAFVCPEAPLALRLPGAPLSPIQIVEAAGEWLDYANWGDTAAILRPQEPPQERAAADYGAAAYIAHAALASEYARWRAEAGRADNEAGRQAFLLSTGRYPAYLEWARKGPGIFRYRRAAKSSAYWGDGDLGG